MAKILVIDDDRGILDAMSMILQEYEYHVRGVSEESEVYPAIKEFSPDLIILDILLSGSDGREICKKLKADEKTRRIPIMLSSAHTDIDKDMVICQANDILPKPFELDTLLHKVENLVSKN